MTGGGAGAGAGAAKSSNSDKKGSEARVKKEKQREKKGYSGRERSILILSGLGFLIGMGLVVFGVLVLLGFYPFENASPQPAFAAPAPGRQVTYGSTIKLMHDKTKYRLHSHDVPYGTGSGQQSVTGYPGVEDSNSYWSIRPALEAKFRQGELIVDGAIVRLFHSQTKKWLHSHLHASPITNNLEVSAFGSETNSDTGDHWRLIIEGKGKTWLRDQKVRLVHVDTGGYLTTHDKKYSRIVAGQQEVCGTMKKNSDNIWMATEGIYFPMERNVEDN